MQTGEQGLSEMKQASRQPVRLAGMGAVEAGGATVRDAARGGELRGDATHKPSNRQDGHGTWLLTFE